MQLSPTFGASLHRECKHLLVICIFLSKLFFHTLVIQSSVHLQVFIQPALFLFFHFFKFLIRWNCLIFILLRDCRSPSQPGSLRNRPYKHNWISSHLFWWQLLNNNNYQQFSTLFPIFFIHLTFGKILKNFSLSCLLILGPRLPEQKSSLIFKEIAKVFKSNYFFIQRQLHDNILCLFLDNQITFYDDPQRCLYSTIQTRWISSNK